MKEMVKEYDELVLIKEEVDNAPTSVVEHMIAKGLLNKMQRVLEREGRSER